MTEMTRDGAYGIIVAPSTTREVKILTLNARNHTPAVGQTMYFDHELDDGHVYRCLGTVTDITTENNLVADAALAYSLSKDMDIHTGADSKVLTLKVQATYRSPDNGETWTQVGPGLLTSPDTKVRVRLMDEVEMARILKSDLANCSYIGTFRGMADVPMPMLLPGFATKRGATHSAIIGRSGSGKTGLAHTLFFAQMRNEEHGFIVVDPQGQWSSESGFIFSLQEAARLLGRDVQVLRVSEDIRLPLDVELMSHIMTETNLWWTMDRMKRENAQVFGEEVSKQVVRLLQSNPDLSPRELLLESLREIAGSRSILSRIYVRGGDAYERLRLTLCTITGEPYILEKGPNAGEEEIPEQEDLREAERTVEAILKKFHPIVNLFSPKNIQGGERRALGGPGGFLSSVLRVRAKGETAPYIILDMSSDTSLNARASYARSTGVDNDAAVMASMRAILDNQDIKAYIVSAVLNEVVRQAETAFAEGGGNLDTKIVFDEAWRFAPQPNRVERGSAIYALTKQLAGYALDTRKYGIGWTYILQSPDDLNSTIWKQLTYVWAGHGMVGADQNMIADLTDDKSQMKLYQQFSSPDSTGIYPFMVTGPVNPLIFTAAPSFVNIFNDVQDLLNANSSWINEICQRRGLPSFAHDASKIAVGARSAVRAPAPPATRLRGSEDRGQMRTGVPVKESGAVAEAPF